MSITPYYGEFMVSPVPLEFGGNYCSHSCPYCFANLSNPKRAADIPTTIRLIENRHDRKSLEGRLLSMGYPVLFSNHSDPFSTSNFRQQPMLIKLLQAHGIPVAIQTRGGKRDAIEDVLSWLNPSVWYISMPYSDDRVRKIIEPASPSVEDRFWLIEQVIKAGHRVILGVNPCVEKWLTKPYEMLSKCRELGAEGVWIGILHINYKQRDAMRDRWKKQIGADVLKTAMKRNCTDEEVEFAMSVRDICQDLGLEFFEIGTSFRSDIWNPFKETYPLLFPTMQDWINHCYDKELSLFSFKQYFDFIAPKLPDITHSSIGNYVRQGVQQVQCDFQLPSKLNYQQLLEVSWKKPVVKCAQLSDWGCFERATTEDEKGEELPLLSDSDLMPIFAMV